MSKLLKFLEQICQDEGVSYLEFKKSLLKAHNEVDRPQNELVNNGSNVH